MNNNGVTACDRFLGIVELHRFHTITDFERQFGRAAEGDVLGNLPDDGGELARGHMRVIAIIDVPELNEDFRPGLWVGAAIQGGELAGLDLSDVITWPDRSSVILKHERPEGHWSKLFQKGAQCNIGGRVSGIVYKRHLRYSIIQYFKDY